MCESTGRQGLRHVWNNSWAQRTELNAAENTDPTLRSCFTEHTPANRLVLMWSRITNAFHPPAVIYCMSWQQEWLYTRHAALGCWLVYKPFRPVIPQLPTSHHYWVPSAHNLPTQLLPVSHYPRYIYRTDVLMTICHPPDSFPCLAPFSFATVIMLFDL